MGSRLWLFVYTGVEAGTVPGFYQFHNRFYTMTRAAFLDRDGVLIKERGDYNYLPEHFIINDGVTQALKYLQEKNYLLIVISNQSGVAKNVYSIETIEQFHQKMIDKLSEGGIKFSEIYYCPHHPEAGLCLCRKPLALLFE